MYKICIVDDHQFIIDGIQRMLESNEALEVIRTFINPKEALKEISENRCMPDLLITDINMPEMSGVELTQTIKATHPEIKVLVLSMHDNTEYIKSIFTAKAEGYILKSSGKKEFLNAINKVLDEGTYYSQNILQKVMKDIPVSGEDNEYLIESLSQREKEILQLILEEKTSKEIAEELMISKQTVDTHRKNLLAKTNAKNLVGLIKFAYESGMV